VYEVSVFPSMTKGVIVGHIVIDVNSRCHYDVIIFYYDEFSLLFIIDEIVIDVNSILVSRECQTLCEDQSSEEMVQ
jgi:hypothetical protein